jgi:GTP-binding protein
LKQRANLCLVFALIDSELTPQAIDLEFVGWLARHAVPFVLAFTKTDKGTPKTVQANIDAFTARIAAWFVKSPTIFTCSATTGQGRSELLGVIDEAMTAIQAEAVQAPAAAEGQPAPSLKVGVREIRKRRPDLARPW